MRLVKPEQREIKVSKFRYNLPLKDKRYKIDYACGQQLSWGEQTSLDLFLYGDKSYKRVEILARTKDLVDTLKKESIISHELMVKLSGIVVKDDKVNQRFYQAKISYEYIYDNGNLSLIMPRSNSTDFIVKPERGYFLTRNLLDRVKNHESVDDLLKTTIEKLVIIDPSKVKKTLENHTHICYC